MEHASSDQQQEVHEIPENIDLQTAVTQASSSNALTQPHNVDLPAKAFHINLQDLSDRFRPYTPPPPPVPLGALQEAAAASKETTKVNRAPKLPKHKSYRTTLTIYESTYPDGQRLYKTHSSPLIIDPTPSFAEDNDKRLPSADHYPQHHQRQPFLKRMRERRRLYEERRIVDEPHEGNDEGEIWQLISVKRQRKLKMKKHKYKKLMKRTKNLRRRLDRL